MAEVCTQDWTGNVGSDVIINGLKVIFKEYLTNTIIVNVAKPWGGTMDMYLSRGVELTKFSPDVSGEYFSATYVDDWVTSHGTGVLIKICKCTAPSEESVVEETLHLISPVGVSTLCEQIIALVHTGKKYWLSQPEYVALGSPAWDEVSITKFNSYPDGTTQIIVKGVTIISRSTSVCVPTAEEDKFAEWIGTITHVVHEELGADEITFKVPINNNSSKTTYNYIRLYDASGKEIDKEPDTMLFYKSISPGGTEIITITSRWKFWSINDVQGQTVTFKLFSSFSRSDLKQAYMKHYVVPTHEEKPEPEPDIEENPTGEIWPVEHQIHKEIGKDEITFTVPVTNTSNKTTYNYIKLFDASGKYLEKEPDILFKSIAPGATSDIILTSKWKQWSIEDVQGQTVTFELFSSFSMLVGLVSVDTMIHPIGVYEEEPPVEPPYEPPYEEPEKPEEPEEEEEKEDDDMMITILIFAIAYILLSGK